MRFSEFVFSATEINCILENRQQSNARAGQKNYTWFGNAQPKCNALAHLEQRKNIVALYYVVRKSINKKI